MRLRNIKNADEIINKSRYIFKIDNEFDGKKITNIDIFNNGHPTFLEIGCGKGDFIIEHAKNNPEINYVGIEKFSSVLVKAINKAEKYNLTNLKFIRFEASKVDEVFDRSFDHLYINFSDPWPKDRHSKRRLTSDVFLQKYEKILKNNAVIEQKTDNIDLFNFSIDSANRNGFDIIKKSYNYHSEAYSIDNIMTEYEKRFSLEGKKICYMAFKVCDRVK